MSGLAAAIPNSPLIEPGTASVTVAWRAWFTILQRRTGGTVGTDAASSAALIAAERDLRIAADNALARAVEAEIAARIAADAAEQAAREAADAYLTAYSRNSTVAVQGEAAARQAADALLVPIAALCTTWAQCNLSFLPTTDPGSGMPWLDNGRLSVGTPATAIVGVGLEDGGGRWGTEDGTGAWLWG